jgi:spore coat polysaccharide biosynthesis protein SpsF (cytidylyltransferase family)
LHVLGIIQARLKSVRLPKKCLAEVNGRSMIAHVWQRANRIIGVDDVVINCPLGDAEAFKASVPEARVLGIPLQEEDVLGSFRKIARDEKADVIIRITGDCPLLDPSIGTDVLRCFLGLCEPLAFCANDTTRSGFPDGTDVEVFSMQGLTLASDNAKQREEREHVTLWMRRRLPCFTIVAPYDVDLKDRKWSVDVAADLDRVRGIYDHLHPEHFDWSHTLRAEKEAELV